MSYENVVGSGRPSSPAVVKIGDKTVTAPTGTVVNHKFDEESAAYIAAFKKEMGEDPARWLPHRADPAKMNKPMMIAILVYLVILHHGVRPHRRHAVSCSPRASATPR